MLWFKRNSSFADRKHKIMSNKKTNFIDWVKIRSNFKIAHDGFECVFDMLELF